MHIVNYTIILMSSAAQGPTTRTSTRPTPGRSGPCCIIAYHSIHYYYTYVCMCVYIYIYTHTHYDITLHYIMLYHMIVYCSILYYITLYCIVLYHIVFRAARPCSRCARPKHTHLFTLLEHCHNEHLSTIS